MAFDRANIQTVTLDDFSGGLHYDELAEDTKDSEAVRCQNVWFNHKLTTVPGISRVNYQIGGSNSSTKINGICSYQKRDLSRFLVVATQDDLLYDNSGTWTTFMDPANPINDSKWRFITFNDLLIGTNNSNNPIKWTGAGNHANLGGTPPLAKYIATFNGRVVLGNVTVGGSPFPNQVHFSEIDDPETWNSVDNFFELETDDAQYITGIRQLGQTLVVYKNNSIGIVNGYGLESWTVDRAFKQNVGCVSGDTIRSAFIPINGTFTEVHIFLSNQGLMAFDGTNVWQLPISEPKQIYANYDFWAQMDQLGAKDATGAFFSKRGMYYTFFPFSGDTTNIRGAIYDPRANALWPIYGIEARVAVEGIDDLDNPQVFIGTSDGIVYQIDDSSQGIEQGPELVTNGNMEANSDWTWTGSNLPPVGGRVSAQSAAQQRTLNNSWNIVTVTADDGIGQTVSTTAGNWYRATAWIYCTAGQVKLTVTPTGYAATSSAPVLATSTWTEVSIRFRTNGNTVVSITPDLPSTAYIDDVSIRLDGIPAYWKSRHFTFNNEQNAKILRELLPFVEITGDYTFYLTLAYNKNLSDTSQDIIDISNPGPIYGSPVYNTVIYGSTFLESIVSLQLPNKAFFSVQIGIDNTVGSEEIGSPFSLQKLHVNVTDIGKRFRDVTFIAA